MNMGSCATVQLIWPLKLTFHLLSNAEVTSPTSFFTVKLACRIVRKLPRLNISSRFLKASACRSGWRPMYRAIRARERAPAVVTRRPRNMKAVSGMAAYHGTVVWTSDISSWGRYRMASTRGSCRGVEAWKARVDGRHIEDGGVMEVRESNWHAGCRRRRDDSILRRFWCCSCNRNVRLPRGRGSD